MTLRRAWDIQSSTNWWLSVGFHIDHLDPSVTFHLPGFIIIFGRCKQPGFEHSFIRWTGKSNIEEGA